MKMEMRIAVLLMGLVVVAALAIPTTMADKDPKKAKLNVACTAPGGTVTVDNVLGNASVAGNCTVNGNASGVDFMNNTDIKVKIKAAMGVSVNITIIDNVGNNDYNVEGAASNDSVTYADTAGNDELNFEGEKGLNTLTITDAAGNDDYKGEKIAVFDWIGVGAGMNKIKVN